jgi:hypothetical protein
VARDRYDTDGNREISQQEIESRLKSIYTDSSPWVTVNCQVLQSGRPLPGATVRFVPEPFLEESLHTATGTTDNEGRVHPAVEDAKLPEDMKGLLIMQPGVYRVEIKHASIKEPGRSLGWEVDFLARGALDPFFRL